MFLNLVGIILVFILLSSGSLFLAFYNRRFEESLPLTTGVIIVFLYISYILNILHIGYYILLFIIGCLLLISGYKFIRSEDKKEVLSYFFTPGFFIFGFCFLTVLVLVYQRKVLLWDELRLWGAYPKLLYYDGSLQLGEAAKLIPAMQSYQPGMPIFQFFFTKSALSFKEGYLFLAYAILGMSILLPITKKLTWKHWYYFPVFVLILVVLPIAIGNSGFDSLTYYFTLYIEPMLGLYFGYTIYLSTRKNDNIFDYLTFIFSITTLVLLKDTGIIFATISYLSFLFIQKKNYRKLNRRRVIRLLIPIVTCLLIFISWKGVQKLYLSSNMYAATVKSEEIIGFFTNMSKEQKQILKDFNESAKLTSFDSNFDLLERFAGFYYIFLAIIICLCLIIFLKNKKEKYKYIVATICYIFGSIFFELGLLALYLFSLHIVVCFQRYSSVVLTAGIIFIIMVVIDGLFDKEKYFNVIAIYLALFFVLFTPMKSPYLNIEDSLFIAAIESEEYSEVIDMNINPKKNDIILVFGSSTGPDLGSIIYQHHIYMNLIDEGFPYLASVVLSSEDSNAGLYNAVDINEIMDTIDDYDYVYFIVVNDEDKEEFSSILDANIDNSTLYRVKNNKLEVVA